VDDFKFTPNVREKSTFCVGVFQKPGQEKANQHMHKIVSLISNLKKAVIYTDNQSSIKKTDVKTQKKS
jgi:hypothetical protein